MAKPGGRNESGGKKTPINRPESQTVQVHLRLPAPYADLLKQFARERDQSPSELVRSLLRSVRDAQRAKE